ncbi:hypothetical protein FS837_000713 [Tulasnella sp. UAMH 9824]|nr:hypothetical protein FS837_000713 [Tulasnella sp. UAMH 9824]
MPLNGQYTSQNVPDNILAKVIRGDRIFADVLKAGPMAGTGLDEQRAEDLGLKKNHWLWRVQIDKDEDDVGGDEDDVGEDEDDEGEGEDENEDGGDGSYNDDDHDDDDESIAQIQFGFNLRPNLSVGSNAGQYRGSSRVGSSGSGEGEGEGAHYSDVEILGKPHVVENDQGSLKVSVTSFSIEGEEVKTGGSVEVGVAKASAEDDEAEASNNKDHPHPPNIVSSNGSIILQPIQGPPVPAVLDIKVRSRANPSWRTYFTCSFPLKPRTTFGELLNIMRERHMEGFKFRKIGIAYLGCRDGISQAAAAWHDTGYLLDYMSLEEPHRHLFDLLGWRYSRPTVDANLTDSSSSDNERGEVQPVPSRGFCTSVNPIDRAVWPPEFVHIPHHLLIYKQPPDKPADA